MIRLRGVIMWSSLRTYLQSVSPDDKGALNCLRELEGSDPESGIEYLRTQLLEAGMSEAAIDRFLYHLDAFRRGESAVPLASYAGRNQAEARSLLRTVGERCHKDFDAVSDRWPSPLAHEIRRLQEELSEGTVITVLWQLSDCYELIMKFVCLALASDLLQVRDDSLSRDVRRGLLRSLSGGAWLGLWRDICKRARTHRDELKLPEVIDEGRFWVGEGKGTFCNAFAKLIEHRNNTKGHGALGYDQLEQVQGFVGLVDALAQCARDGLHHFDDLMLFGEDLDQPWAGWRKIRTRHDADCRNHTEHIAPLYLRSGEGEAAKALALSPLIAQRQCAHCGRRDVFMFDSFYGRGEHARFYLNDYLAGHRMSPDVSEVPDFHPLLNGLDLADLSDTEAPTDDAISSDFLQWLEDSLEEARYLAPDYLFDPVREYLQTHDRGVVLLTAPAMVGKSVFSAHLEGALRVKPPEHGRHGRWVVKHFAIRRGLTGLSLDHFDNYLDHDVLRTPRSEGGLGIQPRNNPTSLSALHALMHEAGAKASWPQVFARRLRELMARTEDEPAGVVLVIDGLDELPADSAERGLGACLDAPSLRDALPEGCYLVLTARPADECGAMSGVVSRLQAQTGEGGLHLQIEPQQIIENTRQAAPLSRAYRSLLEKLYDKRIASKKVGVGLDDDDLLRNLLERSLGRFGYMEHIIRLFEEGIVHPEDVAGLPPGAGLYSHYLEELRRQFDPELNTDGASPGAERTRRRNRWQELVSVLCLLAAEERACNAELKEIGTFYPGLSFEGLSLDLLARALNLPRPTYALIKQLVQIRPLLTTHRMGHETYSNVGIGTRDLLESLLQGKAYAEGLREAHQNLYSLHWAETQRQPGIEADAPIKEEILPGLCRASWHRSMTGKLSPAQAEQDALVRILYAAGKSLIDAERNAGLARAMTALMAQVHPLALTDFRMDEEGWKQGSIAFFELGSLYRAHTLAKLNYESSSLTEVDALVAHGEALAESRGEVLHPNFLFLAQAYLLRGGLMLKAPEYGANQAILEFDRVVDISGLVLEGPCQHDSFIWIAQLAMAIAARGRSLQSLPECETTEALAECNRAISILESVTDEFGQDRAPRFIREALVDIHLLRSKIVSAATNFGWVQGVADCDIAIQLLKFPVVMGRSISPRELLELARAYMTRGDIKAAVLREMACAIADYSRAITIFEVLVQSSPHERYILMQLFTAIKKRGDAKRVTSGYGGMQYCLDYGRLVEVAELSLATLPKKMLPQARIAIAEARASLDELKGYVRQTDSSDVVGRAPTLVVSLATLDDFDWIGFIKMQITCERELNNKPLDLLRQACPWMQDLCGEVSFVGRRPVCLANAALIEVRQVRDHRIASVRRMVVLPEMLIHFDGTSDPFVKLVANNVVVVYDELTAASWVRFFSDNLSSSDSLFSIVETEQDVPWTADASADDRARMVAKLRPFVVSRCESDRYQGKATLLYNKDLLLVTFVVAGMQVEMLDQEVLIENLPVHRRRHQDGWIVIDPPGSQFESQE